jgi:hypothetical protein
MKRLIDIECPAGHVQTDVWAERDALPACACGEPTERRWVTSAASAHSDDIPGGIEIRNGICHADGSPRRFYSKSEIRRAEIANNVVNVVRHVPTPGSDKSRFTSRWV